MANPSTNERTSLLENKHSSYSTAEDRATSVQINDEENCELPTQSSGSTSTNIDPSSDTPGAFSLRGLSSKKRNTLILFALANLFSGFGFSIISPFFPTEAAKKGVSPTVTGLIFSIIEFVIFVTSPIFGNYLTRIGPRFTFFAGIFVGGSCNILLGVLDKCPDGTPFIVMCFLCRSMEAVGLSAYITASFAMVSNEFPKHVATVFGILETANGIGLMLGPAVGGLLYEVGGYGLPFFVMGGCILLDGLVVYWCLPPLEYIERKRTLSMWSLLRSPTVIITCVAIMVCSLAISFLDPTLAKHLEKFNLSPALVGVVYVIPSVFYAALSPLWGYLCDTKKIQSPLLVLGNLVCGMGYLLVGPSPLLPFLPYELYTVILGLILLGICIGCNIVPTMSLLVVGAQDIGFEDNLDTYGIVSGLFNSFFCMGAFLGPSAGGVLVESLGFQWASSVIAGLLVMVGLVIGLFFLIRHHNKRKLQALNGSCDGIHYQSVSNTEEESDNACHDPRASSQSSSPIQEQTSSSTRIISQRRPSSASLLHRSLSSNISV